MGTCFEYAEVSLLCGEEDKSIFYEELDNYGLAVDDLDIYKWQQRDTCFGDLNLEEIQFQGEECMASMFEREMQHLPALGYLERLRTGDLDLGARKLAIQWIEKVQCHYNFGPLCVYLAINYLDRFLSAYELPKGKAWMMQLLAVACLSLAAKMEETEVPLTLFLQVGEAKFVFEAKTIQRMELLVLSTLKWRMKAVTPFSFIDSFLKKLNEDQMQRQPEDLLLKCIKLILNAVKGIDFLEFRPSEIAAAVAISVTEETQMPEKPVKAFPFLSHHVQMERVVECAQLIHDLTWSSRCKGTSDCGCGSTSAPQSPICVLDASCLSYNNKSEDESTRSLKRRKLARNLNLEF